MNNKIIYTSLLWLLSIQTVIAGNLGEIDWDAFSVDLSDVDNCSAISEYSLESYSWIDDRSANWKEDSSSNLQNIFSESMFEDERGFSVKKKRVSAYSRAAGYSKKKENYAQRREALRLKKQGTPLSEEQERMAEAHAVLLVKQKKRNAEEKEACRKKVAGNTSTKEDEILAQLHENRIIYQRQWSDKNKSALNQNNSLDPVVSAKEQAVSADFRTAPNSKEKDNYVQRREAYKKKLAGHSLSKKEELMAEAHAVLLVKKKNENAKRRKLLRLKKQGMPLSEEQERMAEAHAVLLLKNRTRYAAERKAYKKKLAGNTLTKEDEILAHSYENRIIYHRNGYLNRTNTKPAGASVSAEEQAVTAESRTANLSEKRDELQAGRAIKKARI